MSLIKDYWFFLFVIGIGIALILIGTAGHAEAAGETYILSVNKVVNSENSAGGCGVIRPKHLEKLRLSGHIRLINNATFRKYAEGEEHAYVESHTGQPPCTKSYAIWEIPYGFDFKYLHLDGKTIFEINKTNVRKRLNEWYPAGVKIMDVDGNYHTTEVFAK